MVSNEYRHATFAQAPDPADSGQVPEPIGGGDGPTPIIFDGSPHANVSKLSTVYIIKRFSANKSRLSEWHGHMQVPAGFGRSGEWTTEDLVVSLDRLPNDSKTHLAMNMQMGEKAYSIVFAEDYYSRDAINIGGPAEVVSFFRQASLALSFGITPGEVVQIASRTYREFKFTDKKNSTTFYREFSKALGERFFSV